MSKPYKMIQDFATGKQVPDIGPEGNRQDVERFLVEQKGYDKADLEIDVPMDMTVAGEPYKSRVDLVVRVDGTPYMAFKCVAGYIGSRDREIASAARLVLPDAQIPVAVSSDGQNAIVIDTISGKKLSEGMDTIPSKEYARNALKHYEPRPVSKERLEREKLVFRTYDLENVNRKM
jgi:hypothetical protein